VCASRAVIRESARRACSLRGEGRRECWMLKRPIIHEPRLWLKWSVLLISWSLSVLILGIVIVGGNNELSTAYSDAASTGPDLRPPKNQIGAFNYRRWDPNENYRPICSVHFENFSSENNKFGFFKTALHKVVKVRDLELKFYRYNPGEVTAATIPDIFPVPEGITTGTRALVKRIMPRLTTHADGWRVNNIDLGNVSEVRINNFDYQVLYEGDLFFATQSNRATVSNEHSDVVLRGHAKITIADGSTLESNYIKWNVTKQHFRVNGVYVLNRSGVMTTGKGICVDSQLNIVGVQSAKAERRGREKWLEEL